MKPSAHVFVLGALTRSPRILSHARYLAQSGWSVTISGYVDKSEKLYESSNLRVLPIPTCVDFQKYVYPKFLALFLKFLTLLLVLLWHVIRYCRSHVILLQNPPAVPTFLVLFLFVRLTGKHLIIDWHNYGYTLMELSSKRKGICSKIYQQLEVDFASRFLSGDDRIQHICVSEALRQDLLSHGVLATLFYDRAPENFQRTSPEMAHELFSRLRSSYTVFADPAGSARRTRFTEITALPTEYGGLKPQWRHDRPALVVSSCSWTADDDFQLILDSLSKYDIRASQNDSALPHVLFVVTGHGPLKSHYARLIRELRWTHVEVVMPWLDWSDYGVFLGCADLGISVHRSSSGLDLPMKVVDLMGVVVPVLALSYPTLDELLPDGLWGNHFNDSNQLAALLSDLLKTESKPRLGSSKLASYRDALYKHNEQTPRARSYWEQVVLPLFTRAI